MNQQLLNKYDIPVPQYTNYPPANYFHEFTKREYLAAVDTSNHQTRQPLVSFYLHIPFCRHLCHYCGCNSYPMADDVVVGHYVDALHREIDLVATRIDTATRKISQIRYGGGGPTALPIHYLQELNEHLLSLMPAIENPEIAIECHPDYLTASNWEELGRCSFTRYSLGVQDFDLRVLKAVNRRPPLMPISEIMELLRAQGTTINMDLLFGLPLQTPESFAQAAQRAATLHPDRVVTFSCGHVPWVHKRQLVLEKLGLPKDADKQEMYRKAADVFHAAGYRSIGMDHFVLPTDELSIALDTRQLHRNFQGYCTRRTTGQVYAFGVTAISQLKTAYAQNGRDIQAYIDTIRQGKLYTRRGYQLTKQEQIVREVIAQMMCNYHLSWSEIAGRIDITPAKMKAATNYNETKLREMEADGLILLSDDVVAMTSIGSPFVRNVMATLDTLMQHTDKKFSKPV